MIKGQLSKDKVIACENKNADLLKLLNLENVIFFPERDSTSVFIQVRTSDKYGLREYNFLLDEEIGILGINIPIIYGIIIVLKTT